MGAVIEALTQLLLDKAGKQAYAEKRTKIVPKHLRDQVNLDPELCELVHKKMQVAAFAEGGMVRHSDENEDLEMEDYEAKYFSVLNEPPQQELQQQKARQDYIDLTLDDDPEEGAGTRILQLEEDNDVIVLD